MPGLSTNCGPAVLGLHLDLDGLQRLDAAVLAQEPLGLDRVLAHAPFFVGRRDAEDVGPLGPGVGGGPVVGRSGHDLELMNALALLAMDGPQAIGAGVAAADDDRRACRGPR